MSECQACRSTVESVVSVAVRQGKAETYLDLCSSCADDWDEGLALPMVECVNCKRKIPRNMAYLASEGPDWFCFVCSY
jgi:hypothetical protein